MTFFSRTVKLWLPMAFVLTALCGLIVVVAHQVMRQYANDPQIQLAQDAGRQLAAGASPASLLPAQRIELENSQAPFLEVLDAAGAPIASSATLHGKPPSLPAGVFGFARRKGEHQLSWQPEPDVRQAVVIVAANGGRAGFALAGRSLRETELRKRQVMQLVEIGWLGSMFCSAVLAIFLGATSRE